MLDRDEKAEKDAGDDIHALFHGAPKTTEFRKLRKRIIRDTREAIDRYGMVERRDSPDAPREKWLVCLSGGKDSYTLLAALTELQWRGLLPVDILACNLDQGQPGFPATVLPEFLGRMGVPHRIEYADTYSIVIDKVPKGGPIARCVPGSGGATSTASRARKGAARWCSAITATTSSRPSF
jgi:tRNA 2-thiocytidine biosynthesis protein TtcA